MPDDLEVQKYRALLGTIPSTAPLLDKPEVGKVRALQGTTPASIEAGATPAPELVTAAQAQSDAARIHEEYLRRTGQLVETQGVAGTVARKVVQSSAIKGAAAAVLGAVGVDIAGDLIEKQAAKGDGAQAAKAYVSGERVGAAILGGELLGGKDTDTFREEARAARGYGPVFDAQGENIFQKAGSLAAQGAAFAFGAAEGALVGIKTLGAETGKGAALSLIPAELKPGSSDPEVQRFLTKNYSAPPPTLVDRLKDKGASVADGTRAKLDDLKPTLPVVAYGPDPEVAKLRGARLDAARGAPAPEDTGAKENDSSGTTEADPDKPSGDGKERDGSDLSTVHVPVIPPPPLDTSWVNGQRIQPPVAPPKEDSTPMPSLVDKLKSAAAEAAGDLRQAAVAAGALRTPQTGPAISTLTTPSDYVVGNVAPSLPGPNLPGPSMLGIAGAAVGGAAALGLGAAAVKAAKKAKAKKKAAKKAGSKKSAAKKAGSKKSAAKKATKKASAPKRSSKSAKAAKAKRTEKKAGSKKAAAAKRNKPGGAVRQTWRGKKVHIASNGAPYVYERRHFAGKMRQVPRFIPR